MTPFKCEDCGAHMLKARGGHICSRCWKPIPETAEPMRIPRRVRTSLPLPCVGRGETQRGDCVVGAENRHSVEDGRPTPAGIARRASGEEPAEARRQASPKSSSARPR